MAVPELLESLGQGRFQLIRAIGEGGMGIVFEAYDQATATRVALKTLKAVGRSRIDQLKWEFRSLSQLAHPNLIQLFELVATPTHWFFTMELLADARDFMSHLNGPKDEQGRRHPRRPVDGSGLRQLFHQLCLGVQCIHRNRQLHRDIKPTNVLVTAGGRVVLLDFGLSTALDPGVSRPFLPKKLQETVFGAVIGTVGYMAPEQAAGLRVGPPSDCYAIGAMLFEALTGRLPFVGKPQSVLHSKQTYDALAPADIAEDVPEDLNQLCRSLLRRQPGARPSIDELVARFAAAPGAQAHPPALAAAVRPSAPVFVGRDLELSLLRKCLEEVRAGRGGICHVSGASGAGKSALVEQFLRQAQGDGARVFSGRCYENESVPFKAIDDLIDSLARFLLTQDPGAVEALIPEGITELARMFPVLGRISAIARREALQRAPLEPLRSREVAFDALVALVRTLAGSATLVLAIDDLQWSDPESSALLAHLVEQARPVPLLLILVHRSDQVVRNANLQRLMELTPRSPQHLARTSITVGSLAQNETFNLARSLLDEELPGREDLARRFAHEAGGSALFVAELVRHASLAAVAGGQGAISLGAMIWNRITAMEGAERALLELICINGGPIRLADLRGAVPADGGFYRALNQLRSQRLIRLDGLQSDDWAEPFHDRYRETLLERLPSEQVRSRHGALARALEVSRPDDHDALAEHFRRAGIRDRAREEALRAASRAITNLAFAHAERLLTQALDLAESDAEYSDSIERLIHFYTDLHRFADAYAAARRGLKRLREPLPARFSPLRFMRHWFSLEARLFVTSYDRLLSLPVATSQRAVLAITLLNAVAKAAFQIDPALCIWVSVRIVALCLRFGNTPDCAIGYLVFGSIFRGGRRHQYAAGSRYGQLSLALVERYGNRAQRAEVHFVVGYFATMWTQPAAEAERQFAQAYRYGLESGDRFHTGCAAAGMAMSRYFRGEPFAELVAHIDGVAAELGRLRLSEPLDVLLMIRQAMRCLQGRTRAPDALGDEAFDEPALISRLPAFTMRHFAHLYHILKLQLLVVAGRREALPGVLAAAGVYARESIGMPQEAEHTFLVALAASALIHQSARPLRAWRRQLAQAHASFQTWAALCPHNFAARQQLIAAELARTRGQTAEAERGFEAAVEAAQRVGQRNVEAMARLLQGRMHADLGQAEAARRHHQQAAQAFARLGAPALGDRLVLPALAAP